PTGDVGDGADGADGTDDDHHEQHGDQPLDHAHLRHPPALDSVPCAGPACWWARSDRVGRSDHSGSRTPSPSAWARRTMASAKATSARPTPRCIATTRPVAGRVVPARIAPPKVADGSGKPSNWPAARLARNWPRSSTRNRA